jgi:hypothetical protein
MFMNMMFNSIIVKLVSFPRILNWFIVKNTIIFEIEWVYIEEPGPLSYFESRTNYEKNFIAVVLIRRYLFRVDCMC